MYNTGCEITNEFSYNDKIWIQANRLNSPNIPDDLLNQLSVPIRLGVKSVFKLTYYNV